MKANIPNILSVLRILLAPVILYVNPFWRLLILFVIVASDFLDGFLARRWSVVSKFGIIVDPIGDKVSAIVLSYIAWKDSFLTGGELAVVFLRDIELLVFTAFLSISGKWTSWKIQSFKCGKIATLFQGILFISILGGYGVPFIVMAALFVAGIATPVELIFLSLQATIAQESEHLE